MTSTRAERRSRVRRRDERQTLEAGRLAELASRLAGIGYWRYDLATGRTQWSDRMFEIYGCDRDHAPLTADECIARFHPEVAADLRAKMEAVVARPSGKSVEFDLNREDGEVRRVVGQSMVEHDASGVPVAVFGILMDVTEQRRAEEEVRRNEALYRLLAENATDVIARIGLEGETLFVTPSIEQVMGISAEAAVGMRTLQRVHSDDRAALVDGYRRVMTGGEPERIEYRFERFDGRWIWLEACPTLVRDEAGAPKEFIDVARDITARKALETELVAARHEAEAAAEAKAQFLANMSHELRTPITAVLGFTDLLLQRCPLDGEAKRYVERIASGGRALLATVNDVLDFSKLEAGQVRLNAEPMSLADLANETLDLFGAQAARKGLKLAVREDAPAPAWVLGDPDRLRQVLLNLIGNAVKFTETGGVTLELGWAAGTARFAVADTGPGLAPGEAERLFQRFSQVDGSSTRRHEGTGLGLAICKGLVEAMGGDIGVDSVPGQGSRFWFAIPAPETHAPAADDDGEQAAPGEGLRVLVADDNPVNRELVRAILEPFEVTLVEVGDGCAAMRAAEAQAFDVILMDIRMPVCDGRDAARAIRGRPGPNRTARIIAFSADGEAADASGGDASQDATLFDGRLTKPLRPADLLAALADPADAEDERLSA